MREALITLDFPPRELSPNARVHWSIKSGMAKGYRWAAKIEALLSRPTKPLTAPVGMSLTFVTSTARLPDVDNLIASIKSGIDGLVDAGVLVDDSPKYLRLTGATVRKREGKEQPCVMIYLRELSA